MGKGSSADTPILGIKRTFACKAVRLCTMHNYRPPMRSFGVIVCVLSTLLHQQKRKTLPKKQCEANG
ncbi:hypothetical protein [Lambdina fiscellaria nucleopolyhedrovirus]|uniref:Uncharacterized protein n=1 Tax=Lambdina fiscellaria nucleopolyhedrovirus TaxID=1642929 RepID=A0A0E3URD7_9ABAC|nr:hypothetical protein [Lambdina fiscellaria nucleopolyhedrovirus]AKC91750.1 hypothetical protein [Lambdina fiscellaria nucleopolyhedrovirus]